MQPHSPPLSGGGRRRRGERRVDSCRAVGEGQRGRASRHRPQGEPPTTRQGAVSGRREQTCPSPFRGARAVFQQLLRIAAVSWRCAEGLRTRGGARTGCWTLGSAQRSPGDIGAAHEICKADRARATISQAPASRGVRHGTSQLHVRLPARPCRLSSGLRRPRARLTTVPIPPRQPSRGSTHSCLLAVSGRLRCRTAIVEPSPALYRLQTQTSRP